MTAPTMPTLTTTEAATQAAVTIATIRTWCRLGAVAATKTGRRWAIDAESLDHRITLGQELAHTEPEAATVVELPAGAPDLDTIEAAAEAYSIAADQARSADRMKRASRKVLDQVPDGQWGAWQLEHVDLGRETVDLDAVRVMYAKLGLGDVPMRATAPTLKVTRVEAQASAARSLTALAA